MFAADESSAGSVAEYRERVALLCEKFTRATGWTVRFVGDGHEVSGEGVRGGDVAGCQSRMGTIELLLPSGLDADSRRRAQSATGLLVEMIEQLGASWRDSSQRDAEVKRLVEIGETVSTAGDGAEVVPVLLRAAVELTGTQVASFHLLDPNTCTLNLRGQASSEVDEGLEPDFARRVDESVIDLRAMVEGPILVETDSGLSATEHAWLPPKTAAAVCVPVLGADGPLGTIWVSTRRHGGVGDDQVSLLQALAIQLGGLLDRMATRDEQAIRDRVMNELEGLSEAHSGEQLGILPPETGFDVVGRCHSKYEVGGDLCELVPLDEGRTLVAVGDACGHSVQAAFVMTAVRSAMSAVLDDRDAASVSSNEVVRRLNRALCRVTVGHQFMSCLVGVIDSRRMSFVYTNAGHPVPILFRDGSCQQLESHGMPLGILPDAEYTSGELTLRGQDVLVLFSDGVLETMNSRQELFRPEGVVQTIEQGVAGEPIAELLDRIWDASQQHGDGQTEDDKTLLVLRMEPQPVARAPHHSRPDRSSRSDAASSTINSRCS